MVPTFFSHRYSLISRLGGTPPARVWLAHDHLLDRDCVLKGIEGSPASEAASALYREYSLLRRINHPSIVTAIDIGYLSTKSSDEMPPAQCYLTLDYIPGKGLNQLQKAPLFDKLSCFRNVLNAVDVVHQHGFRCGDLKPDHVLVHENGITLVDFGLARNSSSLDVALLPTGTILYMAPEELEGHAADHRADLYSCGVILFELLAGHPPLAHANTFSSRLAALRKGELAATDLLFPEQVASVPASLLKILDRFLCYRPSARFGSAQAALQEIDGCLNMYFPEQHAASNAPPRLLLPEFECIGRENILDALLASYQRVDVQHGGRILLSGPEGSGRRRLLRELAPHLFRQSQGRMLQIDPQFINPEVTALLQSWWASGGILPQKAPAWLVELEQGRQNALNGSAPCLALLCLGLTEVGKSLPGTWTCGTLPEVAAGAPPVGDILVLPPLQLEDVGTMVELASGKVRARETVVRFFAFSEGNVGILRSILPFPEGMECPNDELLVQLRPLAQRELCLLTAEARKVVECASILSEPFGTDLLAVLASDVSAEDFQVARKLLEDSGLMLRCTENGGGLRFRRPVLRAVLCGELDAAKRQALHDKAGRFLERRQQLGASVHDAVIARHFDASGDAAKARRYLARAFRMMTPGQNPLDELHIGKRLLNRLDRDDPERTTVLGRIGQVNLALQRFPQAEAAFLEALNSLTDGGEADPVISALRAGLLYRLATSLDEQGSFSDARLRLESALEQATVLEEMAFPHPDLPPVGRIRLSLAQVLNRDGALDESRKVLDMALSHLRQLNDTPELLEALLLQGRLALDAHDNEAASDALHQALDLATINGSVEIQMKARHNLHLLEARQGNNLKAIQHLEAALRLAESVGDVARMGAGYFNLGNLQRQLGDHRSAMRSYQKAARTFERVGDKAGLVAVEYGFADLLRERGEFSRALERLDQAEQMALAGGGGFYRNAIKRINLVRGEVYLAQGRVQEALPLLQGAVQDALQRGDKEAELIGSVALAEAAIFSGDMVEAERRCAELAKKLETGRLEAMVSRVLMRLHHRLGHFYGQRFTNLSQTAGPEALGPALLDAVKACLPEDGPHALRQQLARAIECLERGGRGQIATSARSLHETLGADPNFRLELLASILDVLQCLGNRRELLARLVSLSAHILGAERGIVLHRRKDGHEVRSTAAVGMQVGEGLLVSDEILKRVIAAEAPVVVDDALEDPSLLGSSSIHDLQIRSVLGLLLHQDDEGFWLLYLDHRHVPGIFASASQPLLERLAALASGLLKETRFRESLLARVEPPRTSTDRYGMVGRSRAIERVREYIDNLGHLRLRNENLLFIGESGTGKELVARAVHQVVSNGTDIPFVAQSCADIPAELIESTLFGYRRGAFTGAREDRPGLFELANGGVLFLDETGELPLNLQASLLRVLEERKVARVGSPEHLKELDLIVVCATNLDLQHEVDAGRFRRDLFHRLNQVFYLPPLRERREDILPLLRFFMARMPDCQGLSPEDLFATDALLWFHERSWPGNIRELKNVVDSIPVRIKARRHEQVLMEDLRPNKPLGSLSAKSSEAATSETLREFTERVEIAFIRRVMEEQNWDISSAATRLGLTYQGLRKRVLRYEWMDEVDKHRH